MLSKINQVQKDKICMFTLIWNQNNQAVWGENKTRGTEVRAEKSKGSKSWWLDLFAFYFIFVLSFLQSMVNIVNRLCISKYQIVNFKFSFYKHFMCLSGGHAKYSIFRILLFNSQNITLCFLNLQLKLLFCH